MTHIPSPPLSTTETEVNNSFKPDEPYNDLTMLPPAKEVWQALAVYKALAEARAVMAELKGRMPIIPNPLMLINALVSQEAKESSSIENIFTTSEKLLCQ